MLTSQLALSPPGATKPCGKTQLGCDAASAPTTSGRGGTGGLDGPGFVRGERNLLPDATPDFTAWQPLFCVPLKWFHDGLQQVCEKQAVLSQAALRYPGLVEPLGPGASGMLRGALAKQTPALHPKTAVLGLGGDGFCFITPLQSWHRYLG